MLFGCVRANERARARSRVYMCSREYILNFEYVCADLLKIVYTLQTRGGVLAEQNTSNDRTRCCNLLSYREKTFCQNIPS